MTKLLIAAAALAITLTGAAAAPADTCFKGATIDARVLSCETIITASSASPAERAAAYGARGLDLTRVGQWEAALADLDAAIDLGSRDPAVFDARGRSFSELANLQRAAANFDIAVRLAPGNATYLSHRARAHQALGNVDQARSDLIEARTRANGELAGEIERALKALTQ